MNKKKSTVLRAPLSNKEKQAKRKPTCAIELKIKILFTLVCRKAKKVPNTIENSPTKANKTSNSLK
jgi:hypothetical protein